MSERLTDEQVAELIEGEYNDGNGWRVLPECVSALALEVQQTRARRCGNCQHFGPNRGETATQGECNLLPFLGGVFVEEAWGCNDFTPKEEK